MRIGTRQWLVVLGAVVALGASGLGTLVGGLRSGAVGQLVVGGLLLLVPLAVLVRTAVHQGVLRSAGYAVGDGPQAVEVRDPRRRSAIYRTRWLDRAGYPAAALCAVAAVVTLVEGLVAATVTWLTLALALVAVLVHRRRQRRPLRRAGWPV